MASSAGVFGVRGEGGVEAEGDSEREPDFEPDFGMWTEGFGLP
jgi:hypothetical protein